MKANEETIRAIFKASPDTIILLDEHGFIDCNPATLKMFMCSEYEEFLGRHPSEYSPPTQADGVSSLEAANEKISTAYTTGSNLFEWTHQRLNGEVFPAEVQLTLLRLKERDVLQATVRDITDRKMIESELQGERQFLSALLDNIDEAMVSCDAQGKLVRFNQAAQQMHGLPAEPIFPEQWAEYYDLYKADGHSLFRKEEIPLFRALNGEHIRDVEMVVAPKNGPTRSLLASGQALLDSSGSIAGAVVTMHDITERKQAEDKIRQLAFYDSLTQLPNRYLLNDRLAQAMAASSRSKHYGALMFLDLDNFKQLNDTHGHDVGDLLLIEVAHRITSCVREADSVARFGGDEFLILINELNADEAISITEARIAAEKVLTTVREPYVLKTQQGSNAQTTVEHHCSASIGVALFINHETSMSDIIKGADMAMYQAKKDGRNQISFSS